ncbi:MAG: hypothetical protein ACI4WG_01195, partial [Erysipelotrichaceae bacterium]
PTFLIGNFLHFYSDIYNLTFIIRFNNKEEQVKLHYSNQSYITADKIEKNSLLDKYYETIGFGLKVINLE